MSAAERLKYYAAHFPLVEVDSTYYAPPTARNAELWAQRTPPGFVFDLKVYGMLTGHAGRIDRLPPALREEIAKRPVDDAGRPRNLYLDQLTDEGVAMLWEIHRAELQPLRAAGKLGALLFQFPPWFHRNRRNAEYIAGLPDRLPGDRIAVEFRGGGWLEPDSEARTLQLLESRGIAYVCVDEPQGFANSTPPVTAVTAPLAYVRLHGRNADTWNVKGPTAAHRFNYLYSEAELREWAPRVRELARGAESVHVLFNNNYQDVGIRNARQMTMLLDEP
jgi:uncharacterized protein YecE (DUF72 family)